MDNTGRKNVETAPKVSLMEPVKCTGSKFGKSANTIGCKILRTYKGSLHESRPVLVKFYQVLHQLFLENAQHTRNDIKEKYFCFYLLGINSVNFRKEAKLGFMQHENSFFFS
jgi:hypothetical protein